MSKTIHEEILSFGFGAPLYCNDCGLKHLKQLLARARKEGSPKQVEHLERFVARREQRISGACKRK